MAFRAASGYAEKELSMCCCDKPNVNGEMGYKWQPNDAPRVRPVDPPTLQDGEVLLYDEPGRCGGIDSHSYHYRVIKDCGTLYLLAKHGAGEDRIRLSLYNNQEEVLVPLSSNDRYWLLNVIHHTNREALQRGEAVEKWKWQTAAAEKRIKTRKQRNSPRVDVWIEN